MGLKLDNFVRTVFGNKRVVICNCSFDSSYPTGGESLTPSDLGIGTIEFLIAEPKLGYVFNYDYTNKKLLAYVSGATGSPLGQVANNTDLSSVVDVKILAIGYALSR